MLAALSDEGGDRGPAFQAFCLDSLALFDTLIPELAQTGIDLRHRQSGVLHLALTDAEAEHLRHRFQDQRSLAPDNRWLEAADIRREEPGVSSKAVAALLSPREHYLDPIRLTQALARAAESLGAKIVTNAGVTGFRRSGDRLTGVQAGGQTYAADAVLLAAGPWTGLLAARLGTNVPGKPMRGQMLSLQGPKEPLRHVIWGSRAYLVPREDGQTFVGATVEDMGFRKRTTAAAMTMLQRAAGELSPELATAQLNRSWAGLRPASPDGLPIMGRLPGWTNAWVATGHFRNGILLSALSGKLMAESILEGEPADRLADFAPTRFSD
jgi:glycine oxidase